MKKVITIFIMFIFLLSAAGCGSNNSKQIESSRGESQSSLSPSSLNIVSTVSDVISENLSSSAHNVSQTQQVVLNKVKKALSTNVSLVLPESVPLESGKYLTAVTSSCKSKYSVKFYQSRKPTEVNSKDASKGVLIAEISGTKYKDSKSAEDNIIGYVQENGTAGDAVYLGHNIKAWAGAGLSHRYLIWTEGHWHINIDSPGDNTMQNKKYQNNIALAKNVAAYLDKNMLPSPQKTGVIFISIWNESYGTVAEWQNGSILYQVDCSDPMTALEIAVAMKSK